LEAAEFYVSVFPNSKITDVTHYTEAGPGKVGDVLTVDFVLDGQRVTAINGGPELQLDAAFSFVVDCADQQEVDYYWDKLLEGGGQEVQCGWLTDRFGLSWQVVPTAALQLFADDDPQRAARATKAMFGMKKLDLAALQAAADGN
jgi:predicted 3-demethylubiquinone-9 3-methyltransferase (glyoxalase superfamily)